MFLWRCLVSRNWSVSLSFFVFQRKPLRSFHCSNTGSETFFPCKETRNQDFLQYTPETNNHSEIKGLFLLQTLEICFFFMHVKYFRLCFLCPVYFHLTLSHLWEQNQFLSFFSPAINSLENDLIDHTFISCPVVFLCLKVIKNWIGFSTTIYSALALWLPEKQMSTLPGMAVPCALLCLLFN